MKAARIEDGELQIQDLEVPEPGFEEALVRISAAGICHSDLHLARADWYGIGSGVLGHERSASSRRSARAPTPTCRWVTV
jgi:D-arabinose 1-dehydrogenase-like Zn-dependent alcohol dehydrogenase